MKKLKYTQINSKIAYTYTIIKYGIIKSLKCRQTLKNFIQFHLLSHFDDRLFSALSVALASAQATKVQSRMPIAK